MVVFIVPGKSKWNIISEGSTFQSIVMRKTSVWYERVKKELMCHKPWGRVYIVYVYFPPVDFIGDIDCQVSEPELRPLPDASHYVGMSLLVALTRLLRVDGEADKYEYWIKWKFWYGSKLIVVVMNWAFIIQLSEFFSIMCHRSLQIYLSDIKTINPGS